jgi:hypothetical protein
MKNTRTATNAFSLHNWAEFRKIESSKIAKAIRANSWVIG